MLNISNIDDFLMRISVQDMNYSVLAKDTFGDLISVFDPDMDYSIVKKAIEDNRCMRNKTVDSGVNHTEIVDTLYIDGNKTQVAILVELGDNGFGTSIKMMVKNVTVFLDGEAKTFLSFESMKSYMSRVCM